MIPDIPTKKRPTWTALFIPIFLVIFSFNKISIIVEKDARVTRNSADVRGMSRSSDNLMSDPLITLFTDIKRANDKIPAFLKISFLFVFIIHLKDKKSS